MKQITKNIRTFAIAVMCFLTAHQPMHGQNYVRTEKCLDASGNNRTTTIQYYDGIGRPVLHATTELGTEGVFVYTQKEYDAKGRESENWLPTPGSNSPGFISNYNILARTTYLDNYPYSQTLYDELDRPISIQGPGNAWRTANRKVTKTYGSNAANTVKHYTVSLTQNNLTDSGYYPAGSLTLEETTDEDNKVMQVYKDMLGHVVLERIVSGDDKLDTYYAYNAKHQLCYVLSPEYQYRGFKEQFGYEYRYNDHGQIDKKILPHCDYEQNFYDTDGRIIYQRNALGKFRFFFYDTYGRQVIKGSCNNYNYHHYKNVSMQTGQDGLYGAGYVFFLPTAITGGKLDEVIFYDDYQFLGKSKFTANPNCSSLVKSSPADATGLQTGSIVRTSSDKYILTAIYYDNLGRVIDKREILDDGSVRSTAITYSFTDKPLTETVTLNRNGSVTTEVKTYNYYSTNDKLQSISMAYNGGTSQTIAEYLYNDIGQMERLTLGITAGDVDYTYNLRGWTTQIDGPGFREWLHYTDGLGTPCYGGNISSQQWQSDSENFKRGYQFTYDGFGRMLKAEYGEGDDFSIHQNRYTEWIKEYMLSGAIRKIERYGKKSDGIYGKIDNLRFYYDGMQVERVKEDALPVTNSGAFDFVSKTINVNEGAEYGYDNDGSLKWDANKGISLIEYDAFGNPLRVQFSNGNVTEYHYSATGEKLQTVFRTAVPNITVPLGSTISLSASNTLSVDSVNYYGNFIFENGQLSQCLFDGGYATFNGGQPVYHHYIKDHLGNNRAVVNHDGTIEQTVHYYPFGATYSDVGSNQSLQRYKYNGKELDRMHGLNLYDYGARQYDPLLCRFNTMDPLAEKYYGTNPYAYCANNPVNNIDSDGKEKLNWLNLGTYDNMNQSLEKKRFNDDKNTINIWAHGNEAGLTYSYMENNTWKDRRITDADDFAKVLSKTSTLWKEHVNNGKKIAIVLHSCSTSDFAQTLSENDLFKGIPIIAPDKDLVVVTQKGSHAFYEKKHDIRTGVGLYLGSFVGDRWTKNEDGHLVGNGNWNAFLNGELLKSFSGYFSPDYIPGGIKFDFDLLWK